MRSAHDQAVWLEGFTTAIRTAVKVARQNDHDTTADLLCRICLTAFDFDPEREGVRDE